MRLLLKKFKLIPINCVLTPCGACWMSSDSEFINKVTLKLNNFNRLYDKIFLKQNTKNCLELSARLELEHFAETFKLTFLVILNLMLQIFQNKIFNNEICEKIPIHFDTRDSKLQVRVELVTETRNFRKTVFCHTFYVKICELIMTDQQTKLIMNLFHKVGEFILNCEIKNLDVITVTIRGYKFRNDY